MNSLLASHQQLAAHLFLMLSVVLTVAGYLVRPMVTLRWLAAGSSVALMGYGVLHPSVISCVVSAVLLPVNVYRALEASRLTRRVMRAASDANMAGLWLKPYMRANNYKAGHVLFNKGDHADKLFLLVNGEMKLSDIGRALEPGRVFGEIALFSPTRIRTHTVQCVTDCTVLEIHETAVRQLYFENPSFGFHLIDLLVSRLSNDVDRVEKQVAAADTHAPT
ncbi:MAG: cyclic nucleotide-binding domain-containing protein [Pseudorhodobacter sp.]|nr:cyclic nucleotide-binding domain-containing protein [Rhizobacter sp.]